MVSICFLTTFFQFYFHIFIWNYFLCQGPRYLQKKNNNFSFSLDISFDKNKQMKQRNKYVRFIFVVIFLRSTFLQCRWLMWRVGPNIIPIYMIAAIVRLALRVFWTDALSNSCRHPRFASGILGLNNISCVLFPLDFSLDLFSFYTSSRVPIFTSFLTNISRTYVPKIKFYQCPEGGTLWIFVKE